MVAAIFHWMTDTEECQCNGQDLMILSRSGGCNVGQIANAAVFRLATGETGKMACLAAVSAGMPGPVTGATQAKMVLAVDGCPVKVEVVVNDDRAQAVIAAIVECARPER